MSILRRLPSPAPLTLAACAVVELPRDVVVDLARAAAERRRPRAPRNPRPVTVAAYDADGIRIPTGGHRPAATVDASGFVRPDAAGRIVLTGRIVGDHRPGAKPKTRKAPRADGLTPDQRTGIVVVRALAASLRTEHGEDRAALASAWRSVLLPAGQRASRGTMPSVGPWLGEDTAADDAEILWAGLSGIALRVCRTEHDAAEAISALWHRLAEGAAVSFPLTFVRKCAMRHERQRERRAARRREHRDGIAAAMTVPAAADHVAIASAIIDLQPVALAFAQAEEAMVGKDSTTAEYKRLARIRGKKVAAVERAIGRL